MRKWAPQDVASSSLGYLQLVLAAAAEATQELVLLLPSPKEGCALQLCGALRMYYLYPGLWLDLLSHHP
jgi:hypothetical protein